MKKIWKSRLLALLLCLGMLLPLLPETAQAAGTTYNYAALGDSITTGYGLDDSETNFADLLAGDDFTVNNLAADGETSDQLLEKLTSDTNYQAKVKTADLITLTIGGNDLMNALYEYLAQETTLSVEQVKKALTDENDANRIPVLTAAIMKISSFDASGTISAFSNNFTQILSAIRTANPDATVIVINQYNPYGHLGSNSMTDPIIAAFDAGVKALNMVFNSGAQTGNYLVADVYESFSYASQNPCNAYINSTTDLNLDFHPNAYGHQLIADTIEKLGVLNRVTASQDAYDRNGFHSVDYTLPDGADLVELQANGQTLTLNDEYTQTYGGVLTLKSDYLNSLPQGSELTLTFLFNEGNPVTKHLSIPETYTITVNSQADDWGYFAANGYTNSSNVYYAVKGEKVELEAIPYLNYEFGCWKQGDEILTKDTWYSFTPDSDVNLTMIFSPAPCFLEFTPSELDFGIVDVTYKQPDARTVTITNTGKNCVDIIEPSSEHFEIKALTDMSLAPGGEASFSIRPKANLPEGKYSESIAVYAVSADTYQPMALGLETKQTGLPEEAMISGDLNVSFQVGKGPVVQTETGGQIPEDKTVSTTPLTGDSGHILNWLLLLAISGVVIGIYGVTTKKRKTK